MKGLNILFNVVWVIFVGLFSAIGSIATGISCCVTIIGIPFGLQHFKFVKLAFAPAGKTVCTHFGKHPVLNVFWWLFGGFVSAFTYCLLGCLFFITIVGIPIARQLFKISKFNFAPFGAEIIGDEEYTSEKNSFHDYELLTKRIIANPDVVLKADQDGESNTVKNYFVNNAERLEKKEYDILVDNKKLNTYNQIFRYMYIAVAAVMSIAYFLFIFSRNVTVDCFMVGVVIVFLMMLLTSLIIQPIFVYCFKTKPLMNYYVEEYKFLFEHYPNGAPVAKCKINETYRLTVEQKTPLTGRVRMVQKRVNKSRIKTILDNIDTVSQ